MDEGISEQLQQLAVAVLENLQFQHEWTNLEIHTHSTADRTPLPRPLVSGLPPRRLYLHPDDQIELLRTHRQHDSPLPDIPEVEWVLPTHLAEKWSLKSFASVLSTPGRDSTCLTPR